MSDLFGIAFTISWSCAVTWLLWRFGLVGIVEGMQMFVRRLAHGPQRPHVARTPRSVLGRPTCAHRADPVPVEVQYDPVGEPEVVGWLCPDCRETVPAPPPPPPAHRGEDPLQKDRTGRYVGDPFITEDARRGFRDAEWVADYKSGHWDTGYLKRESEALRAKLDALTDAVRIDGSTVSMTEQDAVAIRSLLERLKQIREILQQRAERAAWDRLTDAEKHRRNTHAVRVETMISAGIATPNEFRVLACDHDYVNVMEAGSVKPVDSFCSLCGHRRPR